MSYYCNPLNVNYRYQFTKDALTGEYKTAREAADPTMLYYRGKYYIFASMTLGVWESEDLTEWKYHRLPDTLPLYDYAPDVRVIGDYVYFSASNSESNCSYYRTKDIIDGPYEEIEGHLLLGSGIFFRMMTAEFISIGDAPAWFLCRSGT